MKIMYWKTYQKNYIEEVWDVFEVEYGEGKS